MRQYFTYYLTVFKETAFYLRMAKLSKYDIAKRLILSGDIKTIPALFEVVDKTPFAKDINTTPERLERLLFNPLLFRYADVYNMADTLQIDRSVMVVMVHDYNLAKSPKKGK
jgi:hypothetical protein